MTSSNGVALGIVIPGLSLISTNFSETLSKLNSWSCLANVRCRTRRERNSRAWSSNKTNGIYSQLWPLTSKCACSARDLWGWNSIELDHMLESCFNFHRLTKMWILAGIWKPAIVQSSTASRGTESGAVDYNFKSFFDNGL